MVSLHKATLATAIPGTFSPEDEVDHRTLTRLDPWGGGGGGRGSSFEGLTESTD